MEMVKELPSLPSALIRLALADLRACERDDRYFVDMRSHGPITDGRVCLAGAVIVQTLGDTDFAGYGSSVDDALQALDCFRVGLIDVGLKWLHADKSELSEEWTQYARESEYYESDPDEFHDRMHRLADYLASCGL